MRLLYVLVCLCLISIQTDASAQAQTERISGCPPFPVPGGASSKAESWIWAKVCVGEPAVLGNAAFVPDDIKRTDGSCDIEKMTQLGDAALAVLTVRASFLTAMLDIPEDAARRFPPVLALSCVVVPSRLSANHKWINRGLTITRSVIGAVDFSFARFRRTIRIEDSAIPLGLSAYAMRANGAFAISGSTIGNRLNLELARIDGPLWANGVTSTGPVLADYLVARTLAHFERARLLSGIRLRTATIGQDLSFENAMVRGEFNANNLTVGQALLMRGAAQFEDIDLASARIGSYLQFAGAQITGQVNFVGGRADELIFFRPGTISDFGAKADIPIWSKESFVDLGDARVRALIATEPSWQSDGAWIGANLVGFQFDRLSRFSRESQDGTLADATGATLVAWISGVHPGYRDGKFDASPYETVEAALRADGRDSDADIVRFGMYDERMGLEYENADFWAYASSVISRLVVGYGIYPHMAAFWFLGVVLVGAIALTGATLTDRDTSIDVDLTVSDQVVLSLDNATPVISLTKRFDGLDFQSRGLELFFIVLKLFGFLLASYVVGALTGLTG